MLPIKLKIQGVNSYQKEQIIEFDKLLESKIFGIFGEVGSGKSTLLEAISYVLYGKYEKLKGERVSYNLMNLKSNRFVIDFEFVVENENKYRFVAEGRRNSKNFNDVTVKRSYYIWNNNEWLPKEKLDAKKLIGLSFENFNRTIIIPQGKFMEFINLSGTERTKMLKEIFNLYKYDLLDKVAVLQRQNDIDISILEGKLSQLEDINKNAIEINKTSLNKILKQQTIKKKELEQKEKEFNILEKIKADFLRLGELNKSYEKLLKQKPEIEKSEKILKEYELCVIEFKADIERLEEIEENILNLSSKKSEKEIKIKDLDDKLNEISNKFEKLSQENEKLDIYKKQSSEYEIILDIKKEKKAIEAKENQLAKIKDDLKKLKEINQSRQNIIEELKKQITAKDKEIPDISLLAEIKNWFSRAEALQKLIVDSINSIAGRKMRLKRLKDSIFDIFDEKDINALKIDSSLELGDLIVQLENNIGNWYLGLKDLQKERDEMALKDKLKEFAHSLEDGKPCPVCGSVEHPAPLKSDDLQDELDKIYNRIRKGEIIIEKARKYLDKLKELKVNIENEQKNIEDEEKKLKEKKLELESFIKSFKWQDFSYDKPEEVNLAFKNAEKLTEELKKLRIELEKNEKERLNEVEKQESAAKKASETANELSAMNSKYETLSGQLTELDYKDYIDFSLRNIEEQKEKIDKKISDISKEYEKTGQQKKDLEIEITKIKAELNSIKQNLEDNRNKKSQLKQNLDNRLKNFGYIDTDRIKEILKQDLNIDKVKEDINNFKINLGSTKKELDSLKEKLKDDSFDEDKYVEIKKEIEERNKEIVKLIEEKSRLENLILEQKSKLKEKEGFLKEKEEKKLREADLKTMRSLFTSSGFVNFISTVRLQEVVNYANSRFMKLTRGKMKIELNKDNSFDVIDFLNNGERRSIKSLSGGQTFQASLSLALALASIVQQQNKSNQNFFFLDEGFGTQDEESLRLVFDTIKSLRKENRIVGLISHVSQLKEEVNTYLDVVHDEQEGSKIIRSWGE